jgi:hypothetical protein
MTKVPPLGADAVGYTLCAGTPARLQEILAKYPWGRHDPHDEGAVSKDHRPL